MIAEPGNLAPAARRRRLTIVEVVWHGDADPWMFWLAAVLLTAVASCFAYPIVLDGVTFDPLVILFAAISIVLMGGAGWSVFKAVRLHRAIRKAHALIADFERNGPMQWWSPERGDWFGPDTDISQLISAWFVVERRKTRKGRFFSDGVVNPYDIWPYLWKHETAGPWAVVDVRCSEAVRQTPINRAYVEPIPVQVRHRGRGPLWVAGQIAVVLAVLWLVIGGVVVNVIGSSPVVGVSVFAVAAPCAVLVWVRTARGRDLLGPCGWTVGPGYLMDESRHVVAQEAVTIVFRDGRRTTVLTGRPDAHAAFCFRRGVDPLFAEFWRRWAHPSPETPEGNKGAPVSFFGEPDMPVG